MGLTKKTLILTLAAAALPWSSGCGSSPDASSSSLTASESVSEIAGSVIGGSVSFSSSTSSAAMFHEDSERTAASPTACPSLAHATCSGETIKLDFKGCTAANGLGEKWTGVDQYVFTSGSCTNDPEQASVTFVRTFPGGMSQTDATQRTIASNTDVTSGWQTPVAGGGTTFVIDPVANTRTIQINGVHIVATQQIQKGTKTSNQTIWDQTFSASQPLVLDQANQRVSSGSLTVQHNIKKYTATVQIVAPLQFQAGTCNPVSGAITSTWSGSQTGSETLTYLGGDQADLLDSSGNHSTVTLAHCL
jgi:hypothetical protein